MGVIPERDSEYYQTQITYGGGGNKADPFQNIN